MASKKRSSPTARQAQNPKPRSPKLSKSWAERLKQLTAPARRNKGLAPYVLANIEAIKDMLDGKGPDSAERAADAGAHAVANVAAEHVPAFVSASRRREPNPYKNGYDLGKYRVGDALPEEEQRKTREIVDLALPVSPPNEIYFCAVELNGAGIRFYGDLCLVLKASAVPPDTCVLDRNSYDLSRAPISNMTKALPALQGHQRRVAVAAAWSGSYARDLADMVAVRTFMFRPPVPRRLTLGQVGEVLLEDEDYMEVLLRRSFSAYDLLEVRTNATDAAADAAISDRLRRGPFPRIEEVGWRRARRRAERALRSVNLRTRIVASLGRIK